MDYSDLLVWKKSMELCKQAYMVAKQLPKEETYALSDQLRRAAVSIPSNIAEGYGRSSTSDYIRFLNIARGSLYETETQLQLCQMLGYISPELLDECLQSSHEIKTMLNSLIAKVSKRHGASGT